MKPQWLENFNLDNLTPQHSHKRSPSLPCPNHPDKTVTHSLVGPGIQEEATYCEKCSIMLASQGFNVVKLNRTFNSIQKSPICSVNKSERQVQIEEFISDLNGQIELIRDRGLAVEQQLQLSQQNYGKTMDELTTYFQQIEAIIQIQKYLAYNSILSQRTTAETELRSARDALSAELQGLLGIGNDIENNMEAVESVQAEVYETIIQNYQAKLNISYRIEDLELNEITCPDGILADIPKELYSLADKIQIRTDSQPVFSPKGMISANRSAKSSKLTNKMEEVNRPHSSSILVDQRQQNSQSSEHFFFDHHSGFNKNQDMRKAVFNEASSSHKLLPNEMLFRESLNLTEIKENEEEFQGPFRRFSALEETIPEEMKSSQESIDGYLAIDSARDIKANSRREDTDTLLIC